ncbi:MAG: sugar phosphate nucleotidyltransferase [bacterium]|nr:sugar phosphate nucleotidyltransferase [bacterium]
MKCIVLAGGFGTRIRPLTTAIPKPMLPLVNRPILERIVSHLKKHGLENLIMLLYFQPEVIKNYFGDGSDFGVKISYVVPQEDYGTAGACKMAEEYLGDEERILVISGDLLTDYNLKALMDFHEKKKAMVTIGLTRVTDPLQFGIVITDEDSRIVKFLEKPTWGEVFSDTINTGIYLLNREVFDFIPRGTAFDYSKDLFPLLLKEGKPLYGYVGKGYWRDIGDPNSYRYAHYDVFDGKVNISIEGKKLDLVGRDVRIDEDVRIGEDVDFKGTVIIGKNTTIGDRCKIQRSSVGNNCVIEQGAEIIDSIIWDNVYIKRGARVKGAVLMNGVSVLEEAEINEGAVIADECIIGRKAVVRENVKIWPRKIVEDSAVVISNVVWGEKWKRSLFQGSKITGLTNVELTPEMCAKLGSAYGSLLPRNSWVILGRDASPSARNLRRAFIGGLGASGVNIKDAQMIPLPILRFKLSTFGEIGGVYFRQAPDDPPSTDIIFLDSNAFHISPDFAKSIERVFYREDFRRAHYSEAGQIVVESRIFEFYRESYLKSLNLNVLKEAPLKVVFDYAYGVLADFFPYIVNEFLVEYISLNAHVDVERKSKNQEDLKRSLERISHLITNMNYDLGVYFYPGGEKLALIDSDGKVWSGVDLLVFVVFLVINAGLKGTILLPPFVPDEVVRVCENSGENVKFIQSSLRIAEIEAGKHDVIFAGTGEGHLIFPELHSVSDPMFAFGKILEIIASSKINVKELSRSIPSYEIYHERVPCSLEKKGTVMREIAESIKGEDVSFVDGIKIFKENGWILIRPEEYHPSISVYAQFKNREEFEKVLKIYKRIIEEAREA